MRAAKIEIKKIGSSTGFLLPRDVVVRLGLEQGGPSGIRDQNMLESALEHPRNNWAYEGADLAALAAAYGYGIATIIPLSMVRSAHL